MHRAFQDSLCEEVSSFPFWCTWIPATIFVNLPFRHENLIKTKGICICTLENKHVQELSQQQMKKLSNICIN